MEGAKSAGGRRLPGAASVVVVDRGGDIYSGFAPMPGATRWPMKCSERMAARAARRC